MIEQGTIKQRQLEAQIAFLELTLASLQALKDSSLAQGEASSTMADSTIAPSPGNEVLGVALPIAAG